jgi:hypothetical protein
MGSAPEDGELRSARPRARTRAQPRKTTNSASPDPRARTWAQPQETTDSASPDPRARTQLWPQPTVSASPDLDLGGASTSPNLGRGPTTSTGGAIITLPRADSGYGEQDRHLIWLAPPDRQWWRPARSVTTVALGPLTEARGRQKDSTAPTAALSPGSSTPPTATTPHEPGAKISPAATTACT